MSTSAVNQHPTASYNDFKFRIKWNGRYVAGVKMFKAPAKNTDVLLPQKKEMPVTNRKFPGRLKYDAITLEQGITRDAAFIKWARNAWNASPARVTKKRRNTFLFNQHKKDIIIDVFNKAGQKVHSYIVYKCWVSAYQALPELDAGITNAVEIQTITLENEGWERDTDVESDEPSTTKPTDD